MLSHEELDRTRMLTWRGQDFPQLGLLVQAKLSVHLVGFVRFGFRHNSVP
jgi:hypothetical protein